MPSRCRKRLLLVAPVALLVLGFHALPTAGVDLRDVALAAAASIPELDMNAVARSMGQITKSEAFQELKQGAADLGLTDLDLNDLGLPAGLRLRTPGLCAYYDPETDVCHFDSRNGVKARMAGACSGKLDGVVPTCRGYPDAYNPLSQIDIDVTGHVSPSTVAAVPATVPAPAPAPAPAPKHGKQLRPSPPHPAPPSSHPVHKDAGSSDKDSSGDSDYDTPIHTDHDKEKKRTLSGLAALGISVGAAVLCAVLSTLAVALYAHRLRQRGMLLREGESNQGQGAVVESPGIKQVNSSGVVHANKAAKSGGISATKFLLFPASLTPVSEGSREEDSRASPSCASSEGAMGTTPRSCGI